MVDFFIENFQWVLILLLLMNFSQARIKNSFKKRKATLYIATLILALYTLIVVIKVKALPAFLNIIALIFIIAIAIVLRDKCWPFKLKCVKCHKKLPYEKVIGGDFNLCQSCYDERFPEEVVKEEVPLTVEELQDKYSNATTVDEIDWDDWEPTDICVLTHVANDDKLLFIEKKQGLGSGYYNAPGGHVEETETATEAAIREVKEETGLDIANLEQRGVIYFNFKDLRELAYIYYTETSSGELCECEEARPFWQDRNDIPYSNMWEDDIYWLPGFLEGKKFKAYFIFDDKKIIDKKIVWLDE